MDQSRGPMKSVEQHCLLNKMYRISEQVKGNDDSLAFFHDQSGDGKF